MICIRLQGKPFNITVIQVYAPNTNSEKAQVERFYDDLQDLLELTRNKWCPFHHRGLECKSRKSRETCSSRQVWPWCKKWSRAKANRILPKEHAGHSKHPLPTNKRRLCTWTSPDGQHRNQINYILCTQRWRSSIQSTTTTRRKQELTVAQIMNSLLPNSDINCRKWGKPLDHSGSIT